MPASQQTSGSVFFTTSFETSGCASLRPEDLLEANVPQVALLCCLKRNTVLQTQPNQKQLPMNSYKGCSIKFHNENNRQLVAKLNEGCISNVKI